MRHLASLLVAGAALVPLPAGAALLGISLQPVSICVLSDCADPWLEVDYLQRIWAQADVHVEVLAPYATSALDVEIDAQGEAAPLDVLQQFVAWQRLEGISAGTAYIGLTGRMSGGTRGLGYVNVPGFALMPFGLVEASADRFGTATVAHELGHILGAHHGDDRSLMASSISAWSFTDPDYLPQLNAETVREVRKSPFLRPVEDALPVPLPSSAPALVLALMSLLFACRRKKAGN